MRAATRKSLRALAVALAVIVCATTAAAQAPDPANGTWKLNLEKSKFDPGPAPKSATVKIDAVSPIVRKVSFEGVGPDGTAIKWGYSGNVDGKDIPITGTNPDAETVSIKRVSRRVIETTFKRGGKVTMVNTSTISPNDSRILTVVSTGTNASGQKVTNTQVFDKQ